MPSTESIERKVGSNHSRYATADTNLVSVAAAATVGANATAIPLNLNTLMIYNNTAAVKFIKFYDKATAPVIATDSALIKLRLILPASGKIELDSFAGLCGPFTAGIAYCMTGAVGDADATALAANDVIMNLRYAPVGGL